MHQEALTKEAEKLFPKLRVFKEFYLAGGTALALQIGHRISVDFDMFTLKPFLNQQIIQKTKRVFKNHSVVVTYRSSNQVNVTIDNVKATFFHYPYPVIEQLIAYQNVPLATVLEIAAMKAFSIGQRLSYKDYIDWYFLLKEKHIILKKVIAISEKKFGDEFNDRLFLGQLTSFKEIHTSKIDFLRNEVNRKTVETFLVDTVRGFFR